MKVFGFNLSRNMMMVASVLGVTLLAVAGFGWFKSRVLVGNVANTDEDDMVAQNAGEPDHEQSVETNNVQVTPDMYPQQRNHESVKPTQAPPVGAVDGSIDDNLQQGDAPSGDRVSTIDEDDSPLDYNEHTDREMNLAQINLEEGMKTQNDEIDV